MYVRAYLHTYVLLLKIAIRQIIRARERAAREVEEDEFHHSNHRFSERFNSTGFL